MGICKLALENGAIFTGRSCGAQGTALGEAVFNTAMSGYQEVLTDPSYMGQIVTMTYPLMGNYGINDHDVESGRLYLSGFVVKELPPACSNYRATGELGEYLADSGVVGLCGIDTRALTRMIRDHGALRAVLSTEVHDDEALIKQAVSATPMTGRNLVSEVAGDARLAWRDDDPAEFQRRIVVLDCGIKLNILRCLSARGCDVQVVSGLTSVGQIMDCRPEGILVGNGPGDPVAVEQAIETLRSLIGRVPIMGICLGHQLLACALGADIYKLKFGHHGVNHPVKRLADGTVEITSQNHGFAVNADSLGRANCQATHLNLNDHSIEGFAHTSEALFAVQYHPEAAPGPHDSAYLFDLFINMLDNGTLPEGLLEKAM